MTTSISLPDAAVARWSWWPVITLPRRYEPGLVLGLVMVDAAVLMTFAVKQEAAQPQQPPRLHTARCHHTLHRSTSTATLANPRAGVCSTQSSLLIRYLQTADCRGRPRADGTKTIISPATQRRTAPRNHTMDVDTNNVEEENSDEKSNLLGGLQLTYTEYYCMLYV